MARKKLGKHDSTERHTEAALVWARSDPRARAIVAAAGSCPAEELDPSPLPSVEAWEATSWGSPRVFVAAGELEWLSIGGRQGRRLRGRDVRDARRRLGFDGAAVSWGNVAAVLFAPAIGGQVDGA